MRIALSGASGLIGSAVAHSCELRGDKLVRLVRQECDPADPSRLQWNPDSGLRFPERLNGTDVLIHLAGKSIASGRWTRSVKQAIRDSRVKATQQLCSQLASLDNPPRVVVSASAIGIYGAHGSREGQFLDESSPAGHDFLATLADDWENACAQLRRRGIRVVHPRFGLVLSSAGGALRPLLRLFRFGLGGRVGSGDQYLSWITMHDCVAALLWLIESDSANGPYNFVSPESSHEPRVHARSVQRSIQACLVAGSHIRSAVGTWRNGRCSAPQ